MYHLLLSKQAISRFASASSVISWPPVYPHGKENPFQVSIVANTATETLPNFWKFSVDYIFIEELPINAIS